METKLIRALLAALLLALLGLAPAAHAAIALNAANAADSGGTTTVTLSHTVAGPDPFLIIGVELAAGPLVNPTIVTYAGNAMTVLGPVDTFSGDRRVAAYYLAAPPIGTANIVVTYAIAQLFTVGASSWTGVAQTSPVRSANGAAGNNTTATVDITSATGDVVVDVVGTFGIPTLTVGAGQTQRWTYALGTTQRTSGSSEAGATTVTMSWTLGTSGHWAILGASIKPAAATSSYDPWLQTFPWGSGIVQ